MAVVTEVVERSPSVAPGAAATVGRSAWKHPSRCFLHCNHQPHRMVVRPARLDHLGQMGLRVHQDRQDRQDS